MTSLESVLESCRARPVRDYYMGFCPCHDDRVRSLRISVGDSGIRVYCFAGCDWRAVREALGLEGARESVDKVRYRVVKEYDYINPDGRTCFTVVRYHPKKFSKYRIVNDKKVYGLKAGRYTLRNGVYVPYSEGDDESRVIELPAAEPCLYNAYEISRTYDKPVVFVEGEKDADAVTATGLAIGTCLHDGSAAKWYRRFDDLLFGRDVVVIPDCDVPGRQLAAKIIYHMIGIAARLRVLDLDPERWDGYDISDTGDVEHVLRCALSARGSETLASYIRLQEAMMADVPF